MEKEFQLDRQRRYWLAHSLLAAICLAAGCQRWRMPEELTALADSPAEESTAARAPTQPKSSPPKRAEETKETYAWYESSNKGERSAGAYKWRNDRLEEIASEATGVKELGRFEVDGNAEKSTGAIIQLARLELGARDIDLERIARAKSQPLTTRLTAIETLGRSKNDDVSDRLHRIRRQFESDMPSQVAVIPEKVDADRLLAGVIEALALREESLSEFDETLSPLGPPITCTTLMAEFERRRVSPLPEHARSCFNHPNTMVRLALLHWVRAVGDVESVGEVLKITRGGQGEVFFEAIRTLGMLPTNLATARLKELANDQQPRTAGAAQAALIRQDHAPTIQSALSETRWQVKRGIAEFLAEPVTEAQWSYAEALLRDPAPAVQQALARAISLTWSPNAATRAFLVGLESPVPSIRQSYWVLLKGNREEFPQLTPAATGEQLKAEIARIREACQAPPSVAANVDKKPVISESTLRDLVLTWQTTDGASRDLAELKLLSLADQLPDALDKLGIEELRSLEPTFWTSIVAVADPRFEAASGLKSADVLERIEAARRLAAFYTRSKPSLCILVWLDKLMEPEEDLQVWRQILPIAKSATDMASLQVAADIAMNALSIETLDVRITACSILGKAPFRDEFAIAVEPLLSSKGQSEVVAATGVLRQCEQLPASTREKLSALLTSADATCRIEAAAVLSRCGDATGTQFLIYATISGPEIERRLAIERLGDSGSSTHISRLIGLLDASPTLRQAAITSLEKLAPEEVISAEEKPFMSKTEQAARWKDWHASRKSASIQVPR